MFSTIFAKPSVAVPAPPGRPLGAGGQNHPAGHLQGALRGDRATDIARVAFPARVFDVLTDGVEFDAQAFNVCVREVSERGDV
jgi:hypothetical protein